MADRKTYVLVAIQKTGKETAGYFMLDASNFNVGLIKTGDIAGLAKNYNLVNISIEGGKVATNGAASKYPTFYDGEQKVDNIGNIVVIGRTNVNGKASNFTIWSPRCGAKIIGEDELIKYTEKELVANAKVREGHISSIKGSFIVCDISEQVKSSAKNIKVKADLFAIFNDVNSKTKYVSAIVTCSNAVKFAEISEVLDKGNKELIKVLKDTGDKDAETVMTDIPFNAEKIYTYVELGMFVKFCKHYGIDTVSTVLKTIKFVAIKSDTQQERSCTLDKSGTATGNRDVLEKATEDLKKLTDNGIKFVIKSK